MHALLLRPVPCVPCDLLLTCGASTSNTRPYPIEQFINLLINIWRPQVWGFDIMLTDTFRAWLIEANTCPSLAADSPLDMRVKVGCNETLQGGKAQGTRVVIGSGGARQGWWTCG